MSVATIRNICLISGLCLSAGVSALEVGLDGSFNSSTLVDDWGASGHVQLMGSSGYGIDMGYTYQNSISYSALNSTLSHALSQYELAGIWQVGDRAFRLQLLGGAVFSNNWVQAGGQDVITQYSPGYRLDAGVSVPIFTRFRAFAEAGYQGWFNAEIPGHFRWRYGVRLLFGGNSIEPLQSDVEAQQQAQAEQQQAELDNPSVTIDPKVPEYVPSHLSQSLPPIVANAELCKCFPAGPYTLQLGEFSGMTQAIRGMEYRGLRQFFNSRAYLRSPLPVFLAQAETDGPVGLYLGEIESIDTLHYWRHELRKNGLQARFRKVVGTDGERVANPIVSMDDQMAQRDPVYTEEEIRRMNSLPGDEVIVSRSSESVDESLLAEQQAYEQQRQQQMADMNQLTDSDAGQTVPTVLTMGPLTLDQLSDVISSNGMQQVLARSPSIRIPAHMRLIWDETRDEAWVTFNGFASDIHAGEWQAWFESENLSVETVNSFNQPVGDIYHFSLGHPIDEFSVEMDRQETADAIISSMRSPEILWFQAYQRINEHPIMTALNYSIRDNRYRLIASDIPSQAMRQRVWTNLSAVGLLPALAEE